MRVGIGYDVHPLMKGRKLILGGVEIPFEKGLGGHSDADVLAHAIIDALLGAAALPDIGNYFPPDDPLYENISSMVLLERVKELLSLEGWQIINIDATIVAERPRLSFFIDLMKEHISQALGIDIGQLGIKATTTERLGFVGREEGVAAYAVTLVESYAVDNTGTALNRA